MEKFESIAEHTNTEIIASQVINVPDLSIRETVKYLGLMSENLKATTISCSLPKRDVEWDRCPESGQLVFDLPDKSLTLWLTGDGDNETLTIHNNYSGEDKTIYEGMYILCEDIAIDIIGNSIKSIC